MNSVIANIEKRGSLVNPIITNIILNLSTNIVTNLICDKKLSRDDQKKINDFKEKISEFNRNYDNTDIDSNAFQKVIDNEEFINQIYVGVFKSSSSQYKTRDELKKHAIDYAIKAVNKDYKRMERSNVKKEVFEEYFEELITLLCCIREELLDLHESATTSIMINEINKSKNEIIDELKKDEFIDENVFAESSLKSLEGYVNMYKFEKVKTEVDKLLKLKNQLSSKQMSFVFFQEARSYIKQNKYDYLDNEIENIRKIDSNSQYITEIKFSIACNNKDENLYRKCIKEFELHRYATVNIDIKRTLFLCENDREDEATAILLDQNGLKEIFLDKSIAHDMYADFLVSNKNFQLACDEYKMAYSLSNEVICKYNELICKYYIMMDEKYLTEEQFIMLQKESKELYYEFVSLEYIHDYLPRDIQIQFKCIMVKLLIEFNVGEALERIKNENSIIRKEIDYQCVEARALMASERKDEGSKIFKNIWKESDEAAIEYSIILFSRKDWYKLSEVFDKMSDNAKNHPISQMISILVECDSKGYEYVKEKILKTMDGQINQISIVCDLLKLVLDNKDEKLFEIIIDKLKKSKNMYDKYELETLALLLYHYNRNIEIYDLLYDKLFGNPKLIKLFFKSNIDKNNGKLEKLRKIANQLYNEGEKSKELFIYKSEIEYNLGFKRCISTLNEYKKIFNIDEKYCYNTLIYKMHWNELKTIEDEINYLLQSNDGRNLLLVGRIKAELGLWEEGKKYSLKGLYMSYNNLSEDILHNYICLYFANIDKSKVENFEFVEKGTVLILKLQDESDSELAKVRRIIIHKYPNLVKVDGEVKFGCENFSPDSSESLVLIGLAKLGDAIFDDKYIIEEIVDIHLFFHQLCISELLDKFPNQDSFLAIKGTPESSIKRLNEIILKDNQENNLKLNLYNFENEIGVPITFLSGKSTDLYAGTIISLLNEKNQNFYAGKINFYKNRKYVLTFSSLIVLTFFNQINKLLNVSNVCVTDGTVRKVKEGIIDAQKNIKTENGYLSMDSDGELRKYFYTEEDKRNKLKFWTDMLKIVNTIEKIEAPAIENEVFEKINNCILEEDVEVMSVCLDKKHVLVSDDLFIRKLYKSIDNESLSVNSIGFLSSLDLIDFSKDFDIFEKMINSRYLYSVNEDLLLKLLLSILSVENDEERNKLFSRMKKMYVIMMDESSNNFYTEIHQDFIELALENKIPLRILYELVQEAMKFKPYKEFVKEKIAIAMKQMWDNLL